jgi:8-oxo-dGTP diphosphatase
VSEGAGGEARRVAAAVIERHGRVLVQTRPAEGRWQGYWEFPGGGVEAGEDGAECVRRECLEELGLPVQVGPVEHEVSWTYGDVRVEVSFHRCRVDGDAAPRSLEGQQFRWADADDLRTLKFLPANAELVARLADELSSSR